MGEGTVVDGAPRRVGGVSGRVRDRGRAGGGRRVRLSVAGLLLVALTPLAAGCSEPPAAQVRPVHPIPVPVKPNTENRLLCVVGASLATWGMIQGYMTLYSQPDGGSFWQWVL